MIKCKTVDCNRKIKNEHIYCSIECACYDGVFDVRKGWIHENVQRNSEKKKTKMELRRKK